MMDDGLLRGEAVVSWVDVAGREAVRWRSETANAQSPPKHATRMVTPAGSCQAAMAEMPLLAATQTSRDMRARLNRNDIANPPRQRAARRTPERRYSSPKKSEIISVA